MPRSVNHVASRARRKKILKLDQKGYFHIQRNIWSRCQEYLGEKVFKLCVP